LDSCHSWKRIVLNGRECPRPWDYIYKDTWYFSS
jgi:hypothetical protein